MTCLASTFSPNGTNSCVGFLPCSLSNGVLPSRLFRMHPACSTNHGVTGESSLSGSCVVLSIWHLIVLIFPRSDITAFSMGPFDSLSLFTASFVVTSAVHIAATRFLNAIIAGALQRDFAMTKQVNEISTRWTRALQLLSSTPRCS